MLSKGRIKELKSLQQKKYRMIHGLFIVEGDKLVREAMKSSDSIDEIIALPTWEGITEAESNGIPCSIVSSIELKQLSELNAPNQALAVIKLREPSSSLPELAGHWSIYLQSVRDPGNLGTLLRIMDWFGAGHVICSPDCVDSHNQKVVQASMGAIFRVPVYTASEDEVLAKAKLEKVNTYATIMRGVPINRLEPEESGILFLGNESKGLSADLIQKMNMGITIPGQGEAESLNVAVAGGILMNWAIYRSAQP
jgi:TrmH family RNA methyltransferase